jgi:hypothetical protein
MIVKDPPYELVAIFADLDAQRFFEQLIERGQQSGCLRPFRWRSLRDPRRDPVWRSPQAALLPMHQEGCRIFLSWDFHGSGAENEQPDALEEYARNELLRSGVAPESILVACMAPELEKVLGVVWNRVKEVVASVRGQTPPDDGIVLAKAKFVPIVHDVDEGLRRAPKEVFGGLVAALQLRPTACLFEALGKSLSIPQLKQDPSLRQVAARLAEWFPNPGRI